MFKDDPCLPYFLKPVDLQNIPSRLDIKDHFIECSGPVKIDCMNGITGVLAPGKYFIPGRFIPYNQFIVGDPESLKNITSLSSACTSYKILSEGNYFMIVIDSIHTDMKNGKSYPFGCKGGGVGPFGPEAIDRFFFLASPYTSREVPMPDIMDGGISISHQNYDRLLADPYTPQLLLYLDAMTFLVAGVSSQGRGIRFKAEDTAAVQRLMETYNAQMHPVKHWCKTVYTLKSVEQVTREYQEIYNALDTLEPPYSFVSVKEEELELPDTPPPEEDDPRQPYMLNAIAYELGLTA